MPPIINNSKLTAFNIQLSCFNTFGRERESQLNCLLEIKTTTLILVSVVILFQVVHYFPMHTLKTKLNNTFCLLIMFNQTLIKQIGPQTLLARVPTTPGPRQRHL